MSPKTASLQASFLLVLITTVVGTNRTFCPNTDLQIQWIPQMPYIYESKGKVSGELLKHFDEARNSCGCPNTRFVYTNVNVSSSSELEIKIRQTRDKDQPRIYLPVLADKNAENQYQRPFYPLIFSPGPSVIRFNIDGGWTDKLAPLQLFMRSAPYLMVCVLLALLSGFLIWAIELRGNSEQFSRPFPQGVLIGIWWAFVTMTTVGYGDKAPATFIGRVYGIVWMMIGTIVMSLFSGQMTADLASNEIGSAANLIAGKEVATEIGMEAFLKKEANLGAIYIELPFTTLLAQFKDPSPKIKYFVANNYEAINRLHQQRFGKPASDVVTIVKTIDLQFAMGMVLTGRFDRVDKAFLGCLQRAVVDLNEIEMARISYQRKLEEENPTSYPALGGSWLTFLTIVASIFGFFILLGILWEIRRRMQVRQRPGRDSEKGLAGPITNAWVDKATTPK